MEPTQDQPTFDLSSAFSFDPGLYADLVGRIVEAIGVTIIILGAAASTALFVYRFYRTRQFRKGYDQLRGNLGRAVLLGLEFLVAADIIGTVAVEPTFYNLGVLGLIVLIRTFLSFALEVEINGRWPWRAGEVAPEPGDASL